MNSEAGREVWNHCLLEEDDENRADFGAGQQRQRGELELVFGKVAKTSGPAAETADDPHKVS